MAAFLASASAEVLKGRSVSLATPARRRAWPPTDTDLHIDVTKQLSGACFQR